MVRAVKEYMYVFWHLHVKPSEPVILYQMGKVGSTSIRESLKRHGVHPVFHVHRMNPLNIEGTRAAFVKRGQVPPYDRTGAYLYRNVVQNKKKARIITIVREPVSRNISAFFQNYELLSGVDYLQNGSTKNELVSRFLANYPHQVPLTWFNVEMKQTLGIDVFSYPFPKKKGYLIIKQGNFELLILKLDLPDTIKEKIIGNFVGLVDFKLRRHNTAQNKKYAKTYKDFTTGVSLPYTYVKQLCDSKYSRHFYSKSELGAVWTGWHYN